MSGDFEALARVQSNTCERSLFTRAPRNLLVPVCSLCALLLGDAAHTLNSLYRSGYRGFDSCSIPCQPEGGPHEHGRRDAAA